MPATRSAHRGPERLPVDRANPRSYSERRAPAVWPRPKAIWEGEAERCLRSGPRFSLGSFRCCEDVLGLTDRCAGAGLAPLCPDSEGAGLNDRDALGVMYRFKVTGDAGRAGVLSALSLARSLTIASTNANGPSGALHAG